MPRYTPSGKKTKLGDFEDKVDASTLPGITRDIYDRKHQQIAERQQEINRLVQDSHEADSQFKIALSGLISIASKAPDLFEVRATPKKRLLIGFVFSNLSLEGQPSDIP